MWWCLYTWHSSLHLLFCGTAMVNSFRVVYKPYFQLHSLDVILMDSFAFRTLHEGNFKCKCIVILFWILALNVESHMSRRIVYISLGEKPSDFIIFTLYIFIYFLYLYLFYNIYFKIYFIIIFYNCLWWVMQLLPFKQIQSFQTNDVCWFLYKAYMFTWSKTFFIRLINKLFIWPSKRKLLW